MSSSDRGSEWILIAGEISILCFGSGRVSHQGFGRLIWLLGYLAISYRLTGGQPAAGGARASYPGTL